MAVSGTAARGACARLLAARHRARRAGASGRRARATDRLDLRAAQRASARAVVRLAAARGVRTLDAHLDVERDGHGACGAFRGDHALHARACGVAVVGLPKPGVGGNGDADLHHRRRLLGAPRADCAVSTGAGAGEVDPHVRRRAGEGPLQGPERLLAVPRPCRPDPARRADGEKALGDLAPQHGRRRVRDREPRDRNRVLARGLAELRDRCCHPDRRAGGVGPADCERPRRAPR